MPSCMFMLVRKGTSMMQPDAHAGTGKPMTQSDMQGRSIEDVNYIR